MCRHYGWTAHYVWNEITFWQLIFYIEEMQSQMRAENGIREIVIGYVGQTTEADIEELDSDDVAQLISGLDSNAIEVSAADLPPEIREVYLAEMHRIKTGETKPAEHFKPIEEDRA